MALVARLSVPSALLCVLFAPAPGGSAVRDVDVVAVSGTPAPGTPVAFGSAFDTRDFFLSADRRIVFGAPLADGGYGYWAWAGGNTTLLARHGQPPPGFVANTWDFLAATRSGVVTSTGEHALLGGLREGGTFTGKSLWVGSGPGLEAGHLVEVEGAAATGVADANWVSIPLSAAMLPVANGGKVAFVASIEDGDLPGSSVDSDNDTGIWIADGSSTAILVRENQQMPGQPAGTRFHAFGDPVLLPDGTFYFTANAKLPASAFGIFRVTPQGGLELFADQSLVGVVSKLTSNARRTLGFLSTLGVPAVTRMREEGSPVTIAVAGQPSHDAAGTAQGPNYAEFFHLVVADNDSILFLARIADGKRGIWAERDNKLRRLIASGDPAPGLSNQTLLNITQMTASEGGVIAFEATTSGNGGNTGWWLVPRSGPIKPLILPQDQIVLGEGDTRTVTTVKGPVASFSAPSEYGHGRDGAPASINDGEVLLHVFFNNFASAALVLAPLTTTFVVNHTGNLPDENPGDGVCDDGGTVHGQPRCTLRAAIQEANANAGPDRIHFDIPGDDPGFSAAQDAWVILAAQELPEVTESAHIDATTQPGYAGVPRVILDGNGSVGDDTDGFTLAAGSSRVAGFSIVRFFGSGITVSGGASHRIASNTIGLLPDASKAGNNGSGVKIVQSPGNRVGGPLPGDRNVFGDNGLKATGGHNIFISGPAASGNEVMGNYIGVGPDGVTPVGGAIGVQIQDAPGNVVGGSDPSARNVIGGGSWGVDISGASAIGNRIEGNHIGLGADGETPAPNTRSGVRIIDAPGNVVGGRTGAPGAPPGNVISGNRSTAANVHGVEIGQRADGTVVQGNCIGTDAVAGTDRGNGGSGVVVRADSVEIGGEESALGNVISGNDSCGVIVESARGVRVWGNVIGLTANGSAALANDRGGIRLVDAPDNTIGGPATSPGDAPGNVVSGNRSEVHNVHGIDIRAGSSRVVIQGNLIGTDPNGIEARPNGGAGVSIDRADSLLLGDTGETARNVISGNDSSGVVVRGARGVKLEVNVIGARRDLTGSLGNGGDGVRLFDAPAGTFARNVVGGNEGHGFFIAAGSDSGEYRRNEIGIETIAFHALSNAGDGIHVQGGDANRFGSADPGDRNTVWYNGGAGLRVREGARNEVRGGSFFGNLGLGIDLGEVPGINPDDTEDEDDGPNELQNAPAITYAVADTSLRRLVMRGALGSTPLRSFRIEIFGQPFCDAFGFGEGRDRMGEVEIVTDGEGVADFDLELADVDPADLPAFVTALATDASGNSSEFSACRAVTIRPDGPGNPLIVNSTGDASDQDPGDGACDTGGAVGPEPECTLRAALEEAAALAGSQTIEFDIDGAAPHVIAPSAPLPGAGDLFIDGASAPDYRGTPVIVLDGSAAGGADGLNLQGLCGVQALGIIRFGGAGLVLGGPGANSVGLCTVGINPSTGLAAPNGRDGLRIEGSNNRVGGPEGAYPNRIAHNARDGIRVSAGGANTISGNSIYGNAGPAINLVGGVEDAFGVTVNDPGDADSGPNDLVNAPTLTGAEITPEGLRVSGSQHAAPNAGYRLEFFAGPLCDPRGNGQNSTYLGSFSVVTDGAGDADFGRLLGFDATKPGWREVAGSLEGELLTATATDSAGSTSEYSPCREVELVPVVLLAFSAVEAADGVHLDWTTSAEASLIGFHVDRRLVPAGSPAPPRAEWTRLTAALLRPAGNPDGSLRFKLVDGEGAAGADREYLLVGVTRTGETMPFGPFPVSATPVVAARLKATPNPAAGSVRFDYELPAAGSVVLDLFDVAGRRIRRLREGFHEAGRHFVLWDGAAESGAGVPAGVYLMRLEGPGFREVVRVVRTR